MTDTPHMYVLGPVLLRITLTTAWAGSAAVTSDGGGHTWKSVQRAARTALPRLVRESAQASPDSLSVLCHPCTVLLLKALPTLKSSI